MGMHTLSMENINQVTAFLRYGDSQLGATGTILDKTSYGGIFGDYIPGCWVGTQINFLKISAFYIFPFWSLMFLGYITDSSWHYIMQLFWKWNFSVIVEYINVLERNWEKDDVIDILQRAFQCFPGRSSLFPLDIILIVLRHQLNIASIILLFCGY